MTTLPAGLFRKKPIAVSAAHWLKNGDHPLDYSKTHDGLENGELRQFSPEERRANGWEGDIVRYYRHPDDSGERACQHCGKTMHVHGWIDTKEGGHIVCPGDWVITGVQGEHYPCKPDIFAKTYEPANTPPATPQDAPITVSLDPDPRGVSVGVWQGSRCIYNGAPAVPVSAQDDAKDEQAAFEEWLERTCPSGDVEAVQRQWEASSDYADFHAPAAGDARDDLTLAQKYEDACTLANANARDAERLEFLITHGAWVAWSKDHELCRVFHRDEDGDIEPFMGWHRSELAASLTARDAIDKAIAASQQQEG
ncbi:hypothetical protein [Achromobacter sp. K91]|uniref:hypothetical protein n=1 Tax=Achromobacter sp. K91 TaxID=2292262 RepID=UPI001F48BC9B|nr:hypothetical protein [Achromobacter sp. K91]